MWSGIGNYFDWVVNYATDLAASKAIFFAEEAAKIAAHVSALMPHIR